MKFLSLALSLMTTTTLAAKYAPGQECFPNTECNEHCLNGRWGIQNIQGQYILACDTDGHDPQQFYLAACSHFVYDLYGYRLIETDSVATNKTCNVRDGATSCKNGCVFSGKKHAEEEARETWKALCKANGHDGYVPASFIVSTASDIYKVAECHQ